MDGQSECTPTGMSLSSYIHSFIEEKEEEEESLYGQWYIQRLCVCVGIYTHVDRGRGRKAEQQQVSHPRCQ